MNRKRAAQKLNEIDIMQSTDRKFVVSAWMEPVCGIAWYGMALQQRHITVETATLGQPYDTHIKYIIHCAVFISELNDTHLRILRITKINIFVVVAESNLMRDRALLVSYSLLGRIFLCSVKCVSFHALSLTNATCIYGCVPCAVHVCLCMQTQTPEQPTQAQMPGQMG